MTFPQLRIIECLDRSGSAQREMRDRERKITNNQLRLEDYLMPCLSKS